MLILLIFTLPVFAGQTCSHSLRELTKKDKIEGRLFNDMNYSSLFKSNEDLSMKGVGKKVVVEGPFKLKDNININPAKNAILPIVTSILLSDKLVHLYDLPKISDVDKLKEILSYLGVKITQKDNITTFDPSRVKTNMADCNMVTKMRASMLVLGPLISRFGAGKVALPGGCPIGSRPYDLHKLGLEKLGAITDEGEDYLMGSVDGKLIGSHIKFHFPSVGATQNIMSAAVLAEGETIIENAAKEPEIDDLMDFLNKMGAKISWVEPGILKIIGVKELKEVHHRPIGDRIEAGTYVFMALMTNSHVKINGFKPEHMGAALDVLREMGANIKTTENSLEVFPSDLKPVTIKTLPHPGFPTDLQSPFMALLTTVKGESRITETLFENRFMHVPFFNEMGANIKVDGNTAIIQGGQNSFKPALTEATDLRAAAALIMMAARTNGKVEITEVKHLFRGYSDILEKLQDQDVNIEMLPL